MHVQAQNKQVRELGCQVQYCKTALCITRAKWNPRLLSHPLCLLACLSPYQPVFPVPLQSCREPAGVSTTGNLSYPSQSQPRGLHPFLQVSPWGTLGPGFRKRAKGTSGLRALPGMQAGCIQQSWNTGEDLRPVSEDGIGRNLRVAPAS